MDYSKKALLKGSPYYLEECLGLRLDDRAAAGLITFVLLNQPPVCDAHCRRCFMPADRRLRGLREALSIGESTAVLRAAHSCGALCLEISGEGEPTLSGTLDSLIAEAKGLGLITTLITNGHRIGHERLRMMRDSNVTLIFSHFSLDPKRYEGDNGRPGSFHRKTETIDAAIEIYGDTVERANGRSIHRLGIHATLQRDNAQDVRELSAFCRTRHLFFSVAPLAATGSATGHSGLLCEAGWLSLETGVAPQEIPNCLGSNSIIHSHSSAREVGREVCGTCLYGLNIGYDGALLLDAHAGYEVGHILGNVRDVPLEALVRTQRLFSRRLFDLTEGFCPVRSESWSTVVDAVRTSGRLPAREWNRPLGVDAARNAIGESHDDD